MLIIIIIPFIMETLQGKNQNITELDPTILIIVIFVELGACWARPTLLARIILGVKSILGSRLDFTIPINLVNCY